MPFSLAYPSKLFVIVNMNVFTIKFKSIKLSIRNYILVFEMYKVAVICGSLRKASTNAGVLRSIIAAQDKRFSFQWVQIDGFPVFNEDIESQGIPQIVQKARQMVGKADAILFGVPQYNTTISSPLKNAYDWLSRGDKNNYCPVSKKLGAMVSSGGGMGGARAQEHLRQVVSFRGLELLKPSKQAQLMVKRFSGKFFDDKGNLIDQQYRKRIPVFLNQFAIFIQENKK